MTSKKQLYVRPKIAGHVIRDPKTKRRLPDEGGRVPDNSFWRRRLRADEIERIPEPKPAPTPKAKAEPAAPKKDG